MAQQPSLGPPEFLAESDKSWGCRGQSPRPSSGLRAEVDLGGCEVVERLVRALVVVEVEVAIQRLPQFVAGSEVAGVDEFVFDRTPEAFDEDVVQSAAARVSATMPETPQLGAALNAIFQCPAGRDHFQGR